MADLVYFVSNGCWPKNEAPVVGPIRLDSALQVRRLVWDAFTLLRHDLFDSNHPATKAQLLDQHLQGGQLHSWSFTQCVRYRAV